VYYYFAAVAWYPPSTGDIGTPVVDPTINHTTPNSSTAPVNYTINDLNINYLI
jgi:hypothetical protein